MAWWSTVDLKIKTFSDDAAERIEEIDFSEFGFSDAETDDGEYHFSETEMDDFEENIDTEDSGPYYVMRLIEKALGGEGKAVMVLKDTEFEAEYHTCIAYYCLGDGIKSRCFADVDTGLYTFNDFMSALLDMPDEGIGEIYHEMFGDEDDEEYEDEENEEEEEEYDDEYDDDWLEEGRHHQAYLVASTLGYYDYYGSKKSITKSYSGPKVAALFDMVDILKEKCQISESELEYDSFEPDLSWREKYAVQFTDVEKNILNS